MDLEEENVKSEKTPEKEQAHEVDHEEKEESEQEESQEDNEEQEENEQEDSEQERVKEEEPEPYQQEEKEEIEIETESIRVPINNAETNTYEKSFFLKGTNLYCEQKEWNEKNKKILIDDYVNIPEKMKEQYFDRDAQTIRWKYNQKDQIVSNAKLIEWSDGTYNVQIGNELYDLVLGDINEMKVFSVYKNTLFIAQNTIKQRALVKSQKKEII